MWEDFAVCTAVRLGGLFQQLCLACARDIISTKISLATFDSMQLNHRDKNSTGVDVLRGFTRAGHIVCQFGSRTRGKDTQ